MSKHVRTGLFTLVIALLGWGLSSGAFAQAIETGAIAPDWILSTAEGEHISYYQDSENHNTVVLFWATWCPYCRSLMPELEKLRKELAEQPVKFYALNIWEDSDPVAHMQEQNYGFTLLLRADMVAKRYGVQGTPGLMVMDRQKKIRYVRIKGTSATEAAAAVKQALGKL